MPAANADAQTRHDLPAAGEAARLSWSSENIHIVRDAVGGDESPLAATETPQREDSQT